jgi:hypothetical protein
MLGGGNMTKGTESPRTINSQISKMVTPKITGTPICTARRFA